MTPAYKTTEFWVTLLTALIVIAKLFVKIPVIIDNSVTISALATLIVVVGSFIWGRTLVKIEALKKGIQI